MRYDLPRQGVCKEPFPNVHCSYRYACVGSSYGRPCQYRVDPGVERLDNVTFDLVDMRETAFLTAHTPAVKLGLKPNIPILDTDLSIITSKAEKQAFRSASIVGKRQQVCCTKESR